MTFSKIFNSKGFTPLKALANLFVLIGYRSKLIASEKNEIAAAIIEWGVVARVITPANSIVEILNAWIGREWFTASDLPAVTTLIYEDAEKGRSRTFHFEMTA
ncbi:hypothetical protein [Weissella cibaria]|uniref:hypothetical protein n=1 Tax=Weissella cibaria TaxID=137591 RepID=UPI00119276EF|nr:hypothetical protein [Weissella cibaria]TVV32471.1 hypothetical protein FO434_09660 [Weissella cibaria]